LSRFVKLALLLAMALATLPLLKAANTQNADRLAQCLAAKKVTMYGAVWCEHCKDQKELFGDSFKYVPYVECTVNGTRKITEECKSLGIRRTPTWIFPDGQRREGLVPLDQLAKDSGCSVQ
jgi:glutaredoxin